MVEPPLLEKPNADELLYLYLAVSNKAISAILSERRSENPESCLPYVSKVLQGAELNYSAIKKFALVMITA